MFYLYLPLSLSVYTYIYIYICFTPSCFIPPLYIAFQSSVRLSEGSLSAGVSRASWTKACHSKALLRHVALVFTGVARLTLVATALLLRYSCFTPHSLLLYFKIYTHSHALLLYAYSYIYIYIYIYMRYLCFTPASLLLIYLTTVILPYFNIFIYTAALLVLYSYFSCCVCVCVPAYWLRRECGGK